jgi:hypothetical protein
MEDIERRIVEIVKTYQKKDTLSVSGGNVSFQQSDMTVVEGLLACSWLRKGHQDGTVPVNVAHT